ncbi:MAG TPA: 50S ribosomal protein L21e [Candidatus Nanoarchaeia archaeon]|nr:50S ribosomal protein L21e [Candidatus Nanoarchaeia archaeon]
MAQKIGGYRRKTRYKFRKEARQRGKISLTRYLQTFNVGDKVALTVESAVQKGMYNPRFMGKTATVKQKRGQCYEVLVRDGDKMKMVIVHPVHLKRL